MAEMMLEVILPDLPYSSGDEVVALVSGLGATPIMELYILYGTVADLLKKAGIRVYRPYVGNFFTSLEMMGMTLTLMKLDGELKGLESASQAVMSLGNAKVGDKTMVDTLAAAVDAYKKAASSGADFAEALAAMAKAAEQGKESTRDVVAKVGRASRLGERSRGFLDAGAASCAFLLQSIARSISALLAG